MEKCPKCGKDIDKCSCNKHIKFIEPLRLDEKPKNKGRA